MAPSRFTSSQGTRDLSILHTQRAEATRVVLATADGGTT